MSSKASNPEGKLGNKLDAVSWSLFFIWMGIVMITDAPKSAALIGIGVVILGAQAARRYYQMSLERFWIIVGLLFFFGGLWDMFDLNAPFGAFILLAIGALILFSAFKDDK